MSSQAFSPRPWHTKQLIGTHERGWALFYSHSHGTKRLDDGDGEFISGDAQFITLACNSHDALVAALAASEDLGKRLMEKAQQCHGMEGQYFWHLYEMTEEHNKIAREALNRSQP